MRFDKTIQIYIFDGNPNGRIMCELSNWNGRIYKISRNEINEFSDRKDADNTGVYFLFGKDDDNNDNVYIGEAEKISKRLKQHLSDLNYWNDAIAVISKDDLLNKAHVKYLENQFYMLAQKSGRAIIVNDTIPTKSSVSEYDEAMLKEFISNSRLLVNTLGYKVFDTLEETSVKSSTHNLRFYICAARGADAQGIIVSDGFAVLKGSKIATTVTPSYPASDERLRKKLLENGTINENFEFTKNYIFSKPSSAAAVVMGRSANGLTEWKTKDGRILKNVQEEL